MEYIECPDSVAYHIVSYCGSWEMPHPNQCLFLAGSITGAWNWQQVAKDKLLDKFHILNPRRESFDKSNLDVEREQIEWEHEYLEYTHNILFYFSNETLAPITLLEYGCYLASDKKLFVCVHPEYKRKNDVVIQTELRRPEQKIYFNFDEFLEEVKNEYAN